MTRGQDSHVLAPARCSSEPVRGELDEIFKTLTSTARHLQSQQTQGRWLEASTALTRQLLGGAAHAFPLIAQLARHAAGAELAIVWLPEPDSGQGLRAAAADGDSALLPAAAAPSPTIAVTLPLGRGVPSGVLSLVRGPWGTAFSGSEREQIAGFAEYAGLDLQLARARTEKTGALRATERERIARELHDHALPQLLAVSRRVQSLAARLGAPAEEAQASPLESLFRHVDVTAVRIRQVIIELELTATPPALHIREDRFEAPLDAVFGSRSAERPEPVAAAQGAGPPRGRERPPRH